MAGFWIIYNPHVESIHLEMKRSIKKQNEKPKRNRKREKKEVLNPYADIPQIGDYTNLLYTNEVKAHKKVLSVNETAQVRSTGHLLSDF